jgi:hypothetical protein
MQRPSGISAGHDEQFIYRRTNNHEEVYGPAESSALGHWSEMIAIGRIQSCTTGRPKKRRPHAATSTAKRKRPTNLKIVGRQGINLEFATLNHFQLPAELVIGSVPNTR